MWYFVRIAALGPRLPLGKAARRHAWPHGGANHLFYPGTLDGESSLRFMDLSEREQMGLQLRIENILKAESITPTVEQESCLSYRNEVRHGDNSGGILCRLIDDRGSHQGRPG
jgi:hypothetical protein